MRRRTLVPRPPVPRRFQGVRHPLVEGFWALERRASVAFGHLVLPRIPFVGKLYPPQLRSGLTLAEAVVELPEGIAVGDEVRLLLLTDLHAGPLITPAAVTEVTARLSEIDCDLVVWSGDFVTGFAEQVRPHLEAIASVRAACGVYGVLGNHDHYGRDADRLIDLLRGVGVEMLDNQSTLVECRQSRLRLAGIDDWDEGAPDLDRALASAAPDSSSGPSDEEAVVLLSHQPDAYFEASARRVDLVLSGHTHGGQMRVPGLPPLVTMSRHRFVDGHYLGSPPGGRPCHLVISRGLGVVQLPLRTWCDPEVVLVRIRRAGPSESALTG